MFGPAGDVAVGMTSSDNFAGYVTVGVSSQADLAGDITVNVSSPADLAGDVTVSVASPADPASVVTAGVEFREECGDNVVIPTDCVCDYVEIAEVAPSGRPCWRCHHQCDVCGIS